MTLEEVQLFNLLSTVFGRDNIIPNMSLAAVCSRDENSPDSSTGIDLSAGTSIEGVSSHGPGISPSSSYRTIYCLFTIVDVHDNPRLVIDFDGMRDGSGTIEAKRVECHKIMRPALMAAGVKFLTISPDEFAEVIKPTGTADFVALLQGAVDDEWGGAEI